MLFRFLLFLWRNYTDDVFLIVVTDIWMNKCIKIKQNYSLEIVQQFPTYKISILKAVMLLRCNI